MNDNIIKMFIGGEEVVSNKEFTINEEMLSASSTILNNCYPASWEESKDYVSNFYYPKDYSKFILGKGNFTYGTDQYSILTVSGSNFIQFTTNVEKELAGFSIYGNSYQLQTTQQDGDNLFDIMNWYINRSSLGVNQGTFTMTPNSITQSNPIALDQYTTGTTHMSQNPTQSQIDIIKTFGINVESNTTYTISYDNSNNCRTQVFLFFYDENYAFISTYASAESNNARVSYSRTSPANAKYVTIRFDNEGYGSQVTTLLMTNIALKKGNIATYSPFVPNAPTPEYQSRITSVGYTNLFDLDSYFNTAAVVRATKQKIENGLRLNFTAGSDAWVGQALLVGDKLSQGYIPGCIKVKPNTKYILHFSSTPKCFISFLNKEYEAARNYQSLSSNNNETYYILTTDANTYYLYLRLGIQNPNYSSWDFINITCYEGNNRLPYVEYNKYRIDININNKNIFNPITKINNTNIKVNDATLSVIDNVFNFTATGTDLFFGNVYNQGNAWDETRGILIDVSNISQIAISLSNPLFIANYITKYNENLISMGFDNFYFSKGVYTIPNGVKYITFRFGYNHAVAGEKYSTTVQLEVGNKITDFSPYAKNENYYLLNEPLNKVGESTDRLYIDNGTLYLEKNTGKTILKGSETWTLANEGFYINTKNANINIKSKSIILCDYFKNYTNAATLLSQKSGISMLYTNIYQLYVRYTDITSIAEFKNWLSNNNTTVLYELENPIIQEIGKINMPIIYNDTNNVSINSGLETTTDINYYWKNYDVLFAGIVKNSGDISLRPTNPKYCSLQILDYKTFLSESDTLDFVISDKTIAEAITMVVDAISGYGFILGTINISQADDIIGAYSTLNKTAYDVFQYLANISGSRWRARFVDSDTMAIDFYDPELLPRANDIDYTQQYWEDNKIVDLTFNYGTRDYRNKQIILSDEVYGGIDYTEVLLSNGYGTSYITQNNIANIKSITVNGVEAEVITQSEKDLGVDADFYYTPGKNVVESTTSYTAGTQIIITYTPLVKGRQIVYNDEEVTRIATQTNTTGVISRYENRNDILSSDELENIAETYIKYKGKPEIILKLTTLNNDLFNIGEICYFNSPIADLAQDYMVKSKATNYTTVAGETNIFYTYELTSSFNSEKAINYFDNQRNKATGNIAEGESITRNIDINNSAMIIWENATITEISVSVDGDNALNSVLNSPFIQ